MLLPKEKFMKKLVLLLLWLSSLTFAETFTIHILIPNDSCWIKSGAGLVINNDGFLQAMQKDENYPGWYSYSWDNANLPDSVLFYCNDDKTLEHPIGLSEIGDGTLESFEIKLFIKFFKLESSKNNSLYYVPDIEFYRNDLESYVDCNITDIDIRSVCYYKKRYTDLHPPYEPPIKEPQSDVFFSIVNSLGDTIQTETQVTCDTNKIVSYCGGGNIATRSNKLPMGEYQVILKIISEGKEMHYVENIISENPMGLKKTNPEASKAYVTTTENNIRIFSPQPKAYAIINPMGRIVQKGSVKGSTNIIMSPGTYWVKLGSETLRVQVFN